MIFTKNLTKNINTRTQQNNAIAGKQRDKNTPYTVASINLQKTGRIH